MPSTYIVSIKYEQMEATAMDGNMTSESSQIELTKLELTLPKCVVLAHSTPFTLMSNAVIQVKC